MPVRAYLAVFGSLIVLTGGTVAVSIMNLGPVAIYVALMIAMVKAALVVGYFMHLKFEPRFLSLVFFSSLFFFLVFVALTFADLDTRGYVSPEQATFAYRRAQAVQAATSKIGAKTSQGGGAPVSTEPAARPPESSGGQAPASAPASQPAPAKTPGHEAN